MVNTKLQKVGCRIPLTVTMSGQNKISKLKTQNEKWTSAPNSARPRASFTACAEYQRTMEHSRAWLRDVERLRAAEKCPRAPYYIKGRNRTFDCHRHVCPALAYETVHSCLRWPCCRTMQDPCVGSKLKSGGGQAAPPATAFNTSAVIANTKNCNLLKPSILYGCHALARTPHRRARYFPRRRPRSR